MKHTINALLLCLLLQASALSNTVLQADDTQYNFRDWSEQQSFKAHSTFGDTDLSVQSCMLSIDSKATSSTRYVDIITDLKSKELLICEKMDNYSVFNGRIWGGKLVSRCLNIAQSDKVDNINTPDVLISTAITNWIFNPGSNLNGYDQMHIVDLYRVFGVSSKGLSKLGKYGDITDTKVDKNGITYIIKGVGNDDYTITLAKDLSILAASKNGIPIFLISSPQYDVVPNQFTIPSAKYGMVTLTGTTWDLLSTEKEEKIAFCGKAVVSSDTGELWMGPEFSYMAEIGGKLVGVTVNPDSKELWIYTGKTTLPKSVESIAAFNKQLKQFNKEVVANKHKLAPQIKISLSDLFTDKSLFNDDCYYEYYKHGVKDNNYVIVLSNNASNIYAEVTIDVNMHVVGAKSLKFSEIDL
jgi:hypothetical protein